MSCPVSCTSSSYVSALNKKSAAKESNRIPLQQQPLQLPLKSFPFPSSTTTYRPEVDDGGWSMGTPEKGSGWSSCKSYTMNSATLGAGMINKNEFWSLDEARASERFSSSEQNTNSISLMSRKGHGNGAFCQKAGLDWGDSDEAERSQSPGGLTMISFSEGDHEGQQEEVCENHTKSLLHSSWTTSSSLGEKDSNLASVVDDDELSYDKRSPESGGNPVFKREQSLFQHEYGDMYDLVDRTATVEVPLNGRISPNHRSSGGVTPTLDTEGRTSAESNSSVNSLGSVCSWKGEGKGQNPRSCASPRKQSRCDRGNSLIGITGSGGDKDGSGNYKLRKPKKSLPELEDGLGSLHCEPSGWGELPSPNPSGADNGTELWGIPPADQNRPAVKAVDKNFESLSDLGWGEVVPQVVSAPSAEWEGEDSSGAVAAGWSKDDEKSRATSRTPTSTPNEWGSANEESTLTDVEAISGDNLKSNTEVRSSQDDCSSTSVDCDLVEIPDEKNGDMVIYPQSSKKNKHDVSNVPNDAFVVNSSEYQQASTVKQTPHNNVSDSALPNQLLFLKLLQESGGQQALTQRLGQLQMHKRQLVQKLNQLSNVRAHNGGSSNSAQQQNQVVSHNLTAISQMIGQINQQLMILSQLSNQQKDGIKTFEAGTTNVSSKTTYNVPSTQVHARNDPRGFSRSQSASSVVGLGTEPSNYEMQTLCLSNPAQSNVAQSVRSMSRLQQIISGSSSSSNLTVPVADSVIQSNKPTAVGFQNLSVSTGSQSPNVATTSLVGSIGSGSNSHLFKGNPISTSFSTKKSVSDIQEFRPGVPWQPKSQTIESSQGLSKQSSVPSGTNYDVSTFFQQSSPRQPASQLTRSHSTGGSYYSSFRPQGVGTSGSGLGMVYERQMNPGVGHRTYIHGQQPPMTHTEVSSSGSGWKFKGRTVAPPSSLYLSKELHHKTGHHGKKQRTAGVPQSNQGNWTSPYAVDSPSISTSSIHTMWRPHAERVSNAENTRQRWDQSYSQPSHTWVDSQSLNELPNSVHQSISSSSSSELFASSSVSTGMKTWGQDSIQLLHSKSQQNVATPEPTFAEWQAGKKAQLSVNKNPSWLIVRTMNSQASDGLLRNVCNKYGAIQEFIACPSLHCFLLCYQPNEDLVHIKEYLDSDSDLAEANVVVQFATKDDIDVVINQAQEIKTQVPFSQKGENVSERCTPADSTATPSTPFSQVLSISDWNSCDVDAPRSFGQQSVDALTPASSLWSDSGFLSGLSSPWHSGLKVPVSTNPSTTATSQDEVAIGSDEHVPTPSSSSVSPFLPNGLL